MNNAERMQEEWPTGPLSVPSMPAMMPEPAREMREHSRMDFATAGKVTEAIWTYRRTRKVAQMTEKMVTGGIPGKLAEAIMRRSAWRAHTDCAPMDPPAG